MEKKVIHSLVVGILCLHTCVAVAATDLSASPTRSQQVIFTSSSSLLHSRSCGSIANQGFSHHSVSAVSSNYMSPTVTNVSMPSMSVHSTASATFKSTIAPVLVSQGMTPELNRVGFDDHNNDPYLDQPIGELPVSLLALFLAIYLIIKKLRVES